MTNTRTFTEEELNELGVSPYNCLACIDGDKQRRYTWRYLVFEHEGKYWMVGYMDPATEMQDGQERWPTTKVGDDWVVTATQVERVPRIVETWEEVGKTQNVDPAEAWLIDVINQEFDDLNDEEDPPFGCFPVAETINGAAIRVSPDQDAEHWEDQLVEGEAPKVPVVLVVAQRVQ